MGRLNLRHYRAVAAVRSHTTVTAAARALGLTQSAVSHQIAEAERRLDVKLFRRAGRRLVATHAGDMLASNAQTLLNEVERIEGELLGSSDDAETIRIGSYAYGCYRWLPAFLAEIRAELPQTDFELVTDTARPVIESILADETDIGVAAGEASAPTVDVTPLFDDELVAVLPPDHPLGAKPFLIAEDFVPYPFVTYSGFIERGFEEHRLWRPAGKRPAKILRAGLTEAVVGLVKAEFGLAILSHWAVADAVAKGELISRPLTETGLDLRWSALTRKTADGSRTSLKIAHAMQSWCTGRF